ncbi:MAG: helix-turn-helix domain-containing protein [Deltaproteobacteria bacterium]|nr:helix-turn-helix domain-containing protein [Deltaproteobacteria bacterium]
MKKQRLKTSDYLTVHEAAHYLGVSANTLRNWDKQDVLTAYRHPVIPRASWRAFWKNGDFCAT